MHTNSSTALPPKPKTLKSKTNRRTRRRRRNHKPPHMSQQFSCNINPNSFNLWRKTYENIMSWQNQHQLNYWRNQAQNFRSINQELWTKLQKYENKESDEILVDEENKIPEYETSSSEEEDNAEDNDKTIKNKAEIDEEYLKFLEITHKHQNDRNFSRDKTGYRINFTNK